MILIRIYPALKFVILFFLLFELCSCSSNTDKNEEQIRLDPPFRAVQDQDTVNAIKGNLSLAQIQTFPSQVVLTGLAQHRLVTIYKSQMEEEEAEQEGKEFTKITYYEYVDSERSTHFMPGIDLMFGYNLLNIAHYDLITEKTNYLFVHPVLVKSLYYPSYEQDSLDKKPINRNFYMISAYDEDTNKDTLINKTDLRRFYVFNSSGTEKIQVIPADYSVERSQYDAMNDVMYIFSRHDIDRNGTSDKKEPLHIFWIDLKKPEKAKRLY